MDTLPTDTQYPWWVTSMPGWARPYLLLARLDRPIGTWLLLLPCWWGAALGALYQGDAMPSLWHLVIFAVGAFVMRSAGCAFNDMVDKDIDARVERTKARPIASGALSRFQAGLFVVALSTCGLIILLQFNDLTIWLGIASIGLVAAYPFMKRIIWWPQAWLGLTFNWGALLGYTATIGALDWPALALYGAGIAWTLGYDTIYACQDTEDDALVGVRSTARLFGEAVALWVSRFFALSVLLVATALIAAGAPIWGAVVLCSPIAMLFARQAATLKRQNADYLTLFRQHRSIGLLIFAIICIA